MALMDAGFSFSYNSYSTPVQTTDVLNILSRLIKFTSNRVRQLYKNISMLFLFPVKDGMLSTGVNATFNASCYS